MAIPLYALKPRTATQANVISVLNGNPRMGCALIGKTDSGKTQILYSMYLRDVEGAEWPHRFVLIDMSSLVAATREYEFGEGEHPELSTEMIADHARRGLRLSVYIDEFHMFGSFTDYAISKIREIINEMWKHRDTGRLKLSLTANFKALEMIDRFGGSLYRRIEDLCQIVEFS
jgi:hypothetical protein